MAWISLSRCGMGGISWSPNGSDHNVAYSTTPNVSADGQYAIIYCFNLFIYWFVKMIPLFGLLTWSLGLFLLGFLHLLGF